MSHLGYYNNMVSLNNVFYESHKTIIEKVLKDVGQSDKAEEMGFIRYNQVHKIQIHKDNYFHKDLGGIETGPDGMSVAFHAMQILLYMGFSEIVLVGFDCGGDHSYKDKYKNDVCDWGYRLNYQLINRWKLFKKFVEKEYSNVNIKIINPIGLKNIFKEYN